MRNPLLYDLTVTLVSHYKLRNTLSIERVPSGITHLALTQYLVAAGNTWCVCAISTYTAAHTNYHDFIEFLLRSLLFQGRYGKIQENRVARPNRLFLCTGENFRKTDHENITTRRQQKFGNRRRRVMGHQHVVATAVKSDKKKTGSNSKNL